MLTQLFPQTQVKYTSSIDNALKFAENEIQLLDETIETIKDLKPECDKLDYALAASSAALCGVIDIFLVEKPGESSLGHITDKWFEDRTIAFANLVKKAKYKKQGKKYIDFKSRASAIRFLGEIFRIPYDQRGAGDAASSIFDLNPANHHFKSLAHNPSLFGLFFSILDQFKNTSHFVSGGELISLQKADDKFELRGDNVLAKLFCGFVNWLGHLISDVSGSESSHGRGMGIPSPIWSWINDVIAIKRKLNISPSQFDNSVNELALKLYKEGYDARFQTTQAIPVGVNELLVRFLYSVRRIIKYFTENEKEERSIELLWEKCEPFRNHTVKRMLTVAHGTFCAIDFGEATIRGFIAGGGNFNPGEFCMRFNIAGVGRFAVSLYGEVKRGINIHDAEQEVIFARREKILVEDYIKGLKELAEIYDDRELLDFADDLKNGMYIQAFEKSVALAKKRIVPKSEIVSTKEEIDEYFNGEKKNE